MRRLAPIRTAVLAVLGGTLFFAAGCANYHAGSPQAAPFHTVYVAPVVNESFAPQAAGLVATQVRAAFLTDGRVATADAGASEATVAVKLVSYSREVAAARRDDTGLARKFSVTLRAEVTVTDRAGKVLVNRRPVSATRDIFTDGGQQQAEYNNLQLLAEVLAQEVLHSVFDRW